MNKSINVDQYVEYIEYLKKIKLIPDINDLHGDYNHWGNYPLEPSNLLVLYNIYKEDYKFLELGSGAGQVLNFAENIGYKVTGVEFNEELVKISRNTLLKDIRLLDKEFYSDYDVIYCFKPLKEDFEEYINMVVDNMKLGAYIYTPNFFIKNSSLKRIGSFICQKIYLPK